MAALAAPDGGAVLAAVVQAVETVLELPPGSVGPSYALDGLDSIDLVEIAELTEQELVGRGLPVLLDDDSLAGWPDVQAFAGNVRAQLGV